MTKKRVRIFISYAHANESAKSKFLSLLKEQTQAARRFEYEFWDDKKLIPGDDWHDNIQDALKVCDVGILLISPSFLGSSYITEHELPSYTGNTSKRCFPVMLAPVDFDRHDLKGLDKKQIFRLSSDGLAEPRAFNELKTRRKEEFVRSFFACIDDWFVDNNYFNADDATFRKG